MPGSWFAFWFYGAALRGRPAIGPKRPATDGAEDQALMTALLQTSRAQLDRLLDPDTGNVTLKPFSRALP